MATLKLPINARTRLLARIGQGFCALGVILRATILLPICANRAWLGVMILQLEPAVPLPLSDAFWLGLVIVLLIDLTLSSWVLLEMAGLFGALGRGDWNGVNMERRLLRLALAAAIGTLVSICFNGMLSLVVALAGVPGPRNWMLLLSQDNLLKGLGTIFLYLFALIVREMRRLDDENRSFV